MRPLYRITADSIDITKALSDRLISLRVQDHSDTTSDSLSLVLDDRDYTLAVPRTGAQLSVWLGYEETGLNWMGFYTVDELSFSGWPSKMSITAKAADMTDSLKSDQTRCWHGVTLGEIAATIAKEHGLEAKVDPRLSAHFYAHIDQTAENDMSLLTRLSQDVGAIFKPAAGYLILKPRANQKTASGKSGPVMTLAPGDISTYSVRFAERGKFKSVQARWHSVSRGQSRTETVGSGKPHHILTTHYSDQAQAKAAAQAAYDKFARGTAHLSLTLPGQPTLCAETTITVKDLRPGLNQDWIIKKAEHSLSSGGYTTSLACEPPNPSGEKTTD